MIETKTEPKPLTCGKLRALATGGGLMAISPVVLQLADGTPLTVVARHVHKPTAPDPETGKDKLDGVPTLILTVERQYP